MNGYSSRAHEFVACVKCGWCYSILVLCLCVVDDCLSFWTFLLLAIELSVLLRLTDYDYPFGIFKLLLIKAC